MGQIYSLLYSLPPKSTTSSIDELSDEDVYALIENKRDEDAIGFIFNDPTIAARNSIVHRIADDAVVKLSWMPEAFAMNYVSSHTSIPIPRIRRVLPTRPPGIDRDCWIVMDLIDGEPLLRIWDQLSWWRRFLIVLHMRKYIRGLHKVPIPNQNIPGPFDASGEPIYCEGLLFTDGGTPCFNSYDQMADWYDRRRFDGIAMHYQDTGQILQCAKFDRTQPLVVCHMDLHLGNIVIDRKGVPWLIDWTEAGAYPAWFDYVKATVKFRKPPQFWQRCYNFMFGDYRKYLDTFFYPLEDVWDTYMINFPLDYFTSMGIEVD